MENWKQKTENVKFEFNDNFTSYSTKLLKKVRLKIKGFLIL